MDSSALVVWSLEPRIARIFCSRGEFFVSFIQVYRIIVRRKIQDAGPEGRHVRPETSGLLYL